MRHYIATPEAETNGQSIQAFIDNVQSEEIRPILENHNLTSIDPEAWYPLQQWLDVLNDLAQQPNQMFNFIAVGMGIAKHTFLPPEVEQLPFATVMSNIDAIYQGNHRGGYVGKVAFEQISDTHIKFTLIDVVYPDDLEYGVAYGFARRLLPEGSHATVEYDTDIKRLDDGGEKTVIHVKW